MRDGGSGGGGTPHPVLLMLKVLITRPTEDAPATAERVRGAGYDPIIAPFMQVQHGMVAVPESAQAILVSSGNALPGLAPCDLPLLAVGDVTAARARVKGFTDVSSAGRDAEALAALAAAQLSPKAGPLLLACGQGQGARLCADLRARGFRVIRRVAYSTAPVPVFPAAAESALRGGDVHAALFMSGQTAAAFIRLLPPALTPQLANVLALAIGNGAADALNQLPWRQVRLARNPTLDDLLALL